LEGHGFIRDMMDVKVLVLFILSRTKYPIDMQKLYELAFQDDCLSYFDLAQAVPEMVETGHVAQVDDERYVITEKGRSAGAVTEDSIAFPVMQRAQSAIDAFNKEVRRSSFVKTSVQQRDSGDYAVTMVLNDEVSDLLKMELMAPNQKHAYRLADAFSRHAESIYRGIMDQLLSNPEE